MPLKVQRARSSQLSIPVQSSGTPQVGPLDGESEPYELVDATGAVVAPVSAFFRPGNPQTLEPGVRITTAH